MKNASQVIAQWTEPTPDKITPRRLPAPVIISVSAIACLGLAAIGYYQKDFTYYLAAVAAATAGVVLTMQKKRTQALPIIITTESLEVGSKSYLLSAMAGFWLEEEPGAITINVEPQKAAMFPITFVYPGTNKQEVRDLLLHVLPEVESRDSDGLSGFGSYLRL